MTDAIKFSEELPGAREELLQVARQFRLEGLIAKRPESVYKSGRRSGAWVKVKFTQQEFVIGGYTPPERSCKYFGALLAGNYGPSGLLFAGLRSSGATEIKVGVAGAKKGRGTEFLFFGPELRSV